MDILYISSLLLSCLILCVSCAAPEDSTSEANDTFTGKALYDMGTQFNKPLLRLIGKSLLNLECKTHRCTVWSEWTNCKVLMRPFGMHTRTRQCGGTKLRSCESQMTSRQERQSEVCQFCPSDYEITGHGFCLKFYVKAGNKASAEERCKKDGGNLFNVNSNKKWKAFAHLMVKHECTGCVYLDGQRKDSSSPWTYTYEDNIRGFTKWGPGDPDNNAKDLCLCGRKDGSTEGFFDTDCANFYYHVCEIVPT